MYILVYIYVYMCVYIYMYPYLGIGNLDWFWDITRAKHKRLWQWIHSRIHVWLLCLFVLQIWKLLRFSLPPSLWRSDTQVSTLDLRRFEDRNPNHLFTICIRIQDDISTYQLILIIHTSKKRGKEFPKKIIKNHLNHTNISSETGVDSNVPNSSKVLRLVRRLPRMPGKHVNVVP